jgi:hypothetical protein
MELVKALRFQSQLPLKFWGYCILTATHIINILPSRLLSGISPFEKLYGKQPNYNDLRVFGCLAWVFNNTPKNKFDSKCIKGVFVGYPFRQKGYEVYDLETRKIITSRHIKF